MSLAPDPESPERTDAAEALEGQAFLRLVTDRMPVRVAYVDRDFRFRFMNDAYEVVTGLDREQALGRTLAETLGEAVFETVRVNLERAFAGETHAQEFDAPYLDAPRRVIATYVPDPGPDGVVRGAIVQTIDVTEQRASEAALRESEAHYRSLFQSIDDGFCTFEMIFDADDRPVDYRFLEVNDAFEVQTGLSREAAVSRTIRELVPSHEQRWFDLYGRVAQTGESVRVEDRAEGLGRWYEVHAFRIGGEGSREVGAIFKDISARREDERALADARRRLEAVLRAAEVGIWSFDAATGSIGGDANLAAMFGLDEATARNAPAEVFIARIHPDDQGRVARDFGRAATEGIPYEIEYRIVGGGRDRWVVARGYAERDGAGRVVRMPGVVLDITGTKTAQARAEEALVLLRGIAEGTRELIVSVDCDYRLTSLNEAYRQDFLRVFGIEPHVGESVLDLLAHLPDDRAAAQAMFARALGGENVEFTTAFGAEGQRSTFDMRFYPIRDAAGTIVGAAEIARDVTERVRAEAALQAAKDELETRVQARTAELAEAVAQAEGFNYSISHDLRSPLRAMVATASILLEELGPGLDEEHRELLERQAHNARRLGRLIDELLRLSRFARVEVKREPFDMTVKVRSIFAELKEQGRTNGCVLDAQEGMAASGDRELVRTVLHNLLGNACKFSPNGGTIRMRQEGDVFSLSDEGVGFDMAHAGRMFQPFERLVLDSEFEGTGIGLANVKRIVERHGGRVWVESAPGKGSTFFFTLA